MILWELVFITALICIKNLVFAGEVRCDVIGNLYGYNCEFNCSGNNNEHNIFTPGDHIYDGHLGNVYKSYIRTIYLKNCRLQKIESNIFEGFGNLQTLDILDVQLEELHMKTFANLQNLKNLSLSKNHLSELEPHWFPLPHLQTLDLSHNNLTLLNEHIFDELIDLKHLNLSHNPIGGLEIRTLAHLIHLENLSLKHTNISNVQLGTFLHQQNLVSLDLSENSLTHLSKHIFDELNNLKNLDLSHNPIRNLGIGTFAYLTHLENLSLKHTNISSIQLGTFSHQHELVSLDLSENNLKMLDFDLFLPNLHDLQSLYLNQNQLTHLYGFRNEIFPQLILLDIKNNQFNCSYLRSFIANVDWSSIRMPVDPKFTKVHETNIRGVNCKNISTSDNWQSTSDSDMAIFSSTETPQSKNHSSIELMDDNNKITSAQHTKQMKDLIEITSNSFQSLQQLHADKNFMKIILVSVSICIVALVLLIAFLGRAQLSTFLNRQKGNGRRNKFSDPIAEYKNEELLLN